MARQFAKRRKLKRTGRFKKRKQRTIMKIPRQMMMSMTKELKHVNVQLAFSPDLAWTIIDVLPALNQGTDENERIGQWITPKSLTLKFQYQWNVSSIQFQSTTRVIVGRYTSKNLPSTTDVINSASAINSLYQLNTAGTYHILYDKYVVCGRQGSARFFAYRNLYLKMHKRLQYQVTASTVPNNYRYFLMHITDDPDFPPIVNAWSRLNYYG